MSLVSCDIMDDKTLINKLKGCDPEVAFTFMQHYTQHGKFVFIAIYLLIHAAIPFIKHACMFADSTCVQMLKGATDGEKLLQLVDLHEALAKKKPGPKKRKIDEEDEAASPTPTRISPRNAQHMFVHLSVELDTRTQHFLRALFNAMPPAQRDQVNLADADATKDDTQQTHSNV